MAYHAIAYREDGMDATEGMDPVVRCEVLTERAAHQSLAGMGVGVGQLVRRHGSKRWCVVHGVPPGQQWPGRTPGQSFACRIELSSTPVPFHGTTSTAPETELRRKRRFDLPLNSDALMTVPSGPVTLVPAVM